MACRLLAAWTTLLWFASATGLHPTDHSIDILEPLQLQNNSREGVTFIIGHLKQTPAYYFQGDHRDIKLPTAAFQKISDVIRRSPEFTISAWLRQETRNSGTVVGFTRGPKSYLELQSSGRRNEIRFHYTSQVDSKINMEVFPYKLADDVWHHVAVSVSGAEAELFVDCKSLYRRILKSGAPDRNFTVSQELWLGQRANQSHFKGAMQDVRLIAGPLGYLSTCPGLDATCPTCGQFSLLQNTVQELTRHLKELSERLVAAEGRINKVEECDCQKSCRVNGTIHADGATWQRDCDLCACVHGEIQCRHVECPVPACKNPVTINGECCQSCLRTCLMHGVFYDHGDSVNIRQCVECKCQDGNMKCTRIDPETMCPPLPCPSDQQFSVAGECCKFCPGVDYCAKGQFCHANASCLNLQTTYACHCDQGFQGDGHNCEDIDECQHEGGMNGHHCNLNTECVNTRGSYYCKCLPGYKRVNKFNCAEVDECTTGEHRCDMHANCINTQGSYHCMCQEGYTGDGYSCQPVCNQTCLNGGTCVKPGKCVCRSGYTGESCARDLNECATNMHRCTESSVCVNMIGWYYCKCKPGYIGPDDNNILGSLCRDFNECESGNHTCHPSAECINTEGGFYCACNMERQPHCRHSCIYNKKEYEHGTTTEAEDNPCSSCTCKYGVMTCEKPKCDCSDSGIDLACCPQCNPKLSCRHQELTDVILMHGEHWSYDCQQCECQNGEIDCWEMTCPPVSCDNPVQGAEDCCQHCDDLCTLGNASQLRQGCYHAGRFYNSGAQFVDPNDPCGACNCKVPFCAQLVSNVACCVHRTECFTAVMITVAITMNVQWDSMRWWPQQLPWPDSLLMLIATRLKIVTLLNNIVQIYEWLIVILGSSTSVTLWGITRLKGRGAESYGR